MRLFEKGKVQNLLNCRPLRRLPPQAALDQTLQLFAHSTLKHGILCLHFLEKLTFISAFPGGLSMQHFVKNHSKGKNI